MWLWRCDSVRQCPVIWFPSNSAYLIIKLQPRQQAALLCLCSGWVKLGDARHESTYRQHEERAVRLSCHYDVWEYWWQCDIIWVMSQCGTMSGVRCCWSHLSSAASSRASPGLIQGRRAGPGRRRHQGWGHRVRRKNPSANLGDWDCLHCLHCRPCSLCTHSLRSAQDIAGASWASGCASCSRILNMIAITSDIWIRVKLETCCFSEVSDSCHLHTSTSTTCWPQPCGHQAWVTSEWWQVIGEYTFRYLNPRRSSIRRMQQLFAKIARKKTCKVCQRIVPWRIVYMFWVLQLGQVDFIYFMFIKCFIPKMLETIRSQPE